MLEDMVEVTVPHSLNIQQFGLDSLVRESPLSSKPQNDEIKQRRTTFSIAPRINGGGGRDTEDHINLRQWVTRKNTWSAMIGRPEYFKVNWVS